MVRSQLERRPVYGPSRRKPVSALVALAVLAASCGGPPRSGHGTTDARPGARVPTGLARASVHARGVLAYGAATVGDRVVSVELGERFALVARATGAAPRSVDLGPADYDVGALAVDRARGEVWVASTAGTVRGFTATTLRPVATYHLGQRATAVAAGAGYVATGTDDGVLCLRRRGDGALLHCVVAHAGALSSIDMTPAGDRLVTTSHAGDVVVWSLPALAVRARARVGGSANRARFSPDGTRVVIAISSAAPVRSPEVVARERAGTARDPDAAIALWVPGSVPRRCDDFDRAVTAVAWTPDGAHVLAAGWDQHLHLVRAADCRRLARIGGWGGIVRDIEVAPGRGNATIASWVSDLEHPSVVTVDLLYGEETQD